MSDQLTNHPNSRAVCNDHCKTRKLLNPLADDGAYSTLSPSFALQINHMHVSSAQRSVVGLCLAMLAIEAPRMFPPLLAQSNDCYAIPPAH